MELIKEDAGEYQIMCEKKKISFVFTDHPVALTVTTDPDLLGYILRNLIGNAIEYTPEHGKVEITLEEKEGSVFFKVLDTGIGIPKSEQARIFEKFFRASNATIVKSDGSGLGLYIVFEAVKLLGGKIWLESELGKGTTFFVELPLVSQPREGGKGIEFEGK